MENIVELGLDRTENQSEKVFSWMVGQLLNTVEPTEK